MIEIRVVLFILGCSIGSFLNVLIDRLPVGQDVTRSRSHCDYCKHTLFWYELIPVVSWIVQAGKSRCCHKKLSLQYPLIELTTGLGFVFLYQNSIIHYFTSLLLFSSLLVLFVTDLKYEILPNALLGAAGLGAFVRMSLMVSSYTQALFLYVLPAGIAALFFFLLWFFSKGRAMGDGDIPLAFIVGLTTGYPLIIIAFYAAFLTGALVGVILILGRYKTMKSHIPFGPFLIFGAVVARVYGHQLIDIWQKLLLTGSMGLP